MRLDPVELSRLAAVQLNPASYIERRVEELSLLDDYHYAATVTQQIMIPRLHGERGVRQARSRAARRLAAHDDKLSAPNRLVPLGWFPKDRLPDLAVADSLGDRLPALTRDDQGRVASYVFLTRWETRVFAGFSKRQRVLLEPLWEIIGTAVERIVTSSPQGAYLVIYRVRRFLQSQLDTPTISDDQRLFLDLLLRRSDFWEALARLARVRLLVARMPARLDETYLVRVSYTESFSYLLLKPIGIRRRLESRIRRGLRWLGLIGLGVTRDASNLGHAASLWIIFTVPPGLEAVRCFWRSEQHQARTAQRISLDVSKAAVGRHATLEFAPTRDATVLDLQVAPTPDVSTAALVAVLIFGVAVYLYKSGMRLAQATGDERSLVLDLASLFAAAPAGVAGALAFRGTTILRRASSGPRLVIVLLTMSAAALALSVGLRQPAEVTEAIGYVVGVYSLIASGLFLMIRYAPRWRRNDRSRRQNLTRKTAPARCRKRQNQGALVLLLLWLAITGGVAYALKSLHHREVVQEIDVSHIARLVTR